ncbi:MAG: hypothetical protein JSV85_06865 [Candidatus Bathyarchaeota archaeon]|nr:MAG: hypothetical protein JSV85_06865 [Candidatus Bathyarchaeota archaeon]
MNIIETKLNENEKCPKNPNLDKSRRSYPEKLMNQGLRRMKIDKEQFLTVLIAVFGCVVTFSLNHGAIKINGEIYYLPLKLGAVAASALIGLIGGFLFRVHAAVNHSASFAGMSAMIAIATTEQSIMVGVVVGIVYIFLKKMFGGVGGKLGTIGMISTLIVATILLPFNSYSHCDFAAWTAVTPTLVIASIVTGALGSVVTLAVREQIVLKTFKSNDAVIGSAAVGLIGSLLLPYIPAVGSALSLVLYEGSFAGMSSRKRLSGYPAFLTAGALAGAFFAAIFGLFPGCGGKLGFMAFSSVLIYQYGLSRLTPLRNASST